MKVSNLVLVSLRLIQTQKYLLFWIPSTDPSTRVFESGAILVYLAEKFNEFLPSDASARAECMSWLFWQMGSAPYLGGGFGHFYAYAPKKYEYPINRVCYGSEASIGFA